MPALVVTRGEILFSLIFFAATQGVPFDLRHGVARGGTGWAGDFSSASSGKVYSLGIPNSLGGAQVLGHTMHISFFHC